MNTLSILGIAVGLSMDAFAVAIATSIALGSVSRRQLFRLSFHFGLFQALMPVIGWYAGRSIAQWVSGWDHWVAFGLLAFVGGKAIYEAIRGEEGAVEKPRDPTRGWSLVILSVATSIDALAVGFSFAMLGVNVWAPAAIIGCVTGSLTLFGMLMGSRIGVHFGRRVEVLGGLVLIGIGLKILIQHMAG